MDNIMIIWDKLMLNVPNVIEALILLVIAFVCANIVKSLIVSMMNFLKIDKALEKAKVEDDTKTSFKDFFAKLFYLITFILFVPGIFEKLGLTSISQPVVIMMNKSLEYIPNAVASLIVLIIGLCVAKAIRELLVPVLKNLKVDIFLEKIGVKSNISVSELLSTVVYVLILIPVIIASVDVLQIDAISRPATEMLNTILLFMPKIVIAIIIIFIGNFIANIASELLEKVLISIGTDKTTNNLLKLSGTKTEKDFSLSKIISGLVKYLIIVFFLIEGLNILQLDVLTNIGNNIIAYLPYAISSAIVLGIAVIVGNFAEKTINEKFKNSNITALIIKVVIIIIGSFITLYQLGIASTLIQSAFIIILGSLAIAFAISFGMGGREFASHMLAKLEKRIETKKK